jgi:serine/threonine protein kinase
LQQVLNGQATPEDADELARHLETCGRCGETVDRLLEQDQLLELLGRGPKPPPENDSDTLRQLIGRLRQLGGQLSLAEADATTEDSASRHLGTETPLPDADPLPALDHTQADYLDLLTPAEEPGEIGRLGPYRVVRVLGAGGMGVVYQAQQSCPRRTVAVKMLLAGLHGPHRHRFRQEMAVIARLQHPNIVQIHEVGEHEERPYFTMEFADVGNLAQKLADRPLPAREAAQLVETLARAIQYAHEQGFVHRDLKPSNILLMRDGLAKISDFGLAKSLAAEEEATREYRTESGAILGTPGYMAPEQASGDAVGPAADVYALGVILYEALTGRPPFKAVTVLEILELVRSQEPVPPGRLQPGLPRDLETICLKCLHKAPARRYPSAGDLAEDLGRFLRGEPIRARPVSRRERVWKWARRKPALAALVAVSGLSLVGLVGGGLVHNAQLGAAVKQAEANAAEAQQQRSRADADYREARDTLERMLARLESQPVGAVPQLKELQRRLREDALAFYLKALDRADSADPMQRLDTATAFRRAADLQQVLGQREAAEASYQRAIALIEGLSVETRDASSTQILLAGCYQNLGTLVGSTGRSDETERHNRTALDILERLAQAQPDDPAVQNELAKAEHNRGATYQNTKPAEAEPHYDRAVAIRTALVRSHPQEERYQAELAEDHLNLGLIYHRTGRPTEAGRAYETAVGLPRPLVERHPPGGEYALSLAAACVNWVNLLKETGQLQAALQRASEGVDLAEGVLRLEPQHTVARQRVYASHGTRALVNEQLGHYSEAIRDWDRVIELSSEPVRSEQRAIRAADLVRAGEHGRAAAEAKTLAEMPKVSNEILYYLTGVYMLAIGSARSDRRLSSAEQAATVERYAVAAVALLGRLKAAGYFQSAERLKELRTDPDLQPLRGRADFQKLLSQQ